MFDILTILKKMGVKTEFSCQGGLGEPAYVAADLRTFRSVIKDIRKYYRYVLYSPKSLSVAAQFFINKPVIMIEIANPIKSAVTDFFTFIFARNPRNDPWVIEYVFNTKYGAKMVLRWDEEFTDDVLGMLLETGEYRGIKRN